MHDKHCTSNSAVTLLSVVIPAYNEQEVLPEFHRRLSAVLDSLQMQAEIVYVNDGSRDATLEMMYKKRNEDPRVAILDLSRNFGKEIALTSGLDYAHGDVVIVIDADLQDPPELIPELINGWQEGYDVVYARRSARHGETWLKRATAHLFYRLIHRVSRVQIPEDTGDFRLLSRRAVESLRELRETHRFMKGLFAWIGYPQKAVHYKRDSRFAGATKWNYWKLWNFALEGITAFTTAPLKLASYIGLATAAAAFFYSIWVIYKTLIYGDPVAGYPSFIVIVLFLGSIQLMTLGVLGEYVGRMFNESKRRPLYFLKNYAPAKAIILDRDHILPQSAPNLCSKTR